MSTLIASGVRTNVPTLRLKLPPEISAMVAARVASGGYVDADEYVLDLLRRDQRREKQRAIERLLLGRLDRTEAVEMDKSDFKDIRRRFQRRVNGGKVA